MPKHFLRKEILNLSFTNILCLVKILQASKENFILRESTDSLTYKKKSNQFENENDPFMKFLLSTYESRRNMDMIQLN